MARKTLHRKVRKNRRTRKGAGYPDKELIIRIPQMTPKNAQTIKKQFMDTDYFQESTSEIPGLTVKVSPSEKLLIVTIPNPKGRATTGFDASDMSDVFEELEDLTYEVIKHPSKLGKRGAHQTDLPSYNQAYYSKQFGRIGAPNDPRPGDSSSDESMT